MIFPLVAIFVDFVSNLDLHHRASGLLWYLILHNIPTLILGNTVTVMSPDGKPIQINANALQAATAQNPMGMLKVA